MTIHHVHKTYVENYSTLEEAAIDLEARLAELCRAAGVTCRIEARAKTIASFVKKCVGPKAYANPWTQVTDKVGARIITENPEALRKVREALAGELAADLAPHSVEDKSESSDPDALYYPGIHMQVVVPGHTLSTGENLEAELQLRTKAQDLWAATSHKLNYKGVVPLSRQSERRIWRLSVLTEMFDEEVDRVMNELASDPRYLHARYLQIAEAEYLRLVPQPGNDELSLIVLDAIGSAIDDDPEQYEHTLRVFADHNHDKLEQIYSEFGPQSDWASEFNYWLLSQPESIIAFQLIATRPSVLADIILGTELEGPFRELFSAWGHPLPE